MCNLRLAFGKNELEIHAKRFLAIVNMNQSAIEDNKAKMYFYLQNRGYVTTSPLER
jgi:hypothetical protein